MPLQSIVNSARTFLQFVWMATMESVVWKPVESVLVVLRVTKLRAIVQTVFVIRDIVTRIVSKVHVRTYCFPLLIQ